MCTSFLCILGESILSSLELACQAILAADLRLLGTHRDKPVGHPNTRRYPCPNETKNIYFGTLNYFFFFVNVFSIVLKLMYIRQCLPRASVVITESIVKLK